MKKYSTALLSALVISSTLVFSPVTQADDVSAKEQELIQREQELNAREEKINQREQFEATYHEKVREKYFSGFLNMTTAVLEIPKNIINTTNDSNVAFGVIGGMVKGILNTAGRVVTGATDFVTAPIPTKPIALPVHVWDDFDSDTTYGEVFRLDNQPSEKKE
jgi:putative exosortase-associated protein (TIGR04073 family)